MQIAALLQHEWRQMMRSEAAWQWRQAGVYVAGAVTLIFIALDYFIGFRDPGNGLFSTLLVAVGIFLFFLSGGIASRLAADRAAGTFGLLVLTPTSPAALLVAKSVFNVTRGLYFALSVLPCFGIALAYGGIAWERWLAVAILCPTIVAFLCATQLIGPIFTKDPTQAEHIAFVAAVVFGFWSSGLNYLSQLTTGASLPKWLAHLSPFDGFIMVFNDFASPVEVEAFLLSIGLSWAQTIAAVLIGSAALVKVWQRDGVDGTEGFLQRVINRSASGWRASIRPLLSIEPLRWAAALDRKHVNWGWAAVAGVLGIWLAGFLVWEDAWAYPLTFYFTATMMVWAVRSAMIMQIASRARELASGEVDMLMLTGRSPMEIINAEVAGVYLQFRGLVLTARALVLVLTLSPLFVRDWDRRSLAVHITGAGVLLAWARLRPTAALLRQFFYKIDPLGVTQQKTQQWGNGSVIGMILLIQFIGQFGMRSGLTRLYPTGALDECIWVGLLAVAMLLASWAGRRWEPQIVSSICEYFHERWERPKEVAD